jgi:hypothetical protein
MLKKEGSRFTGEAIEKLTRRFLSSIKLNRDSSRVEHLPGKKKYRNISIERASQVLQGVGEVNFIREKGGFHKTEAPMSYLYQGVEKVRDGVVGIDVTIKIAKSNLPNGHIMKIDSLGEEIETTRRIFVNTHHPKGYISFDLENLHQQVVSIASNFTLRPYEDYR